MEFYNRSKETKEIVSYLDSQDENNRILILVGKTGVGKSGLVKMILDTKLTHRLSLRVSVSKNSSDNIENLYYINALYRTMSQFAIKHPFDGVLSPMQYGVLSIKNLFRLVWQIIKSKTIGSEAKIYEPVDEISVLRKKEYIIHLLQKHNYIIDIENIQNIDIQSFEIIQDIIRHVKHTTLILEYTISKEHGMDDVYSFYNEIKSLNAEIHLFTIEKLEFEEAKKLAPENIEEKKLKAIYQRSDGNLIKMLLSSSMMEEDDDPIQFKLNSLSQDEKTIINIIFLNGGKIEVVSLYRLLLKGNPAPPFSHTTIENYLTKLQLDRIVNRDMDGNIYIAHDSILTELEDQPANPPLYIAFKLLKESYMKQLNEGPDAYVIEHLFQLLLKFSDEDMLHIFPYICRLIKSYKYRQPIIAKLTHFREMIIEQGTISYNSLYEFSLSMVTLCLELGFRKEAQESLDLIYSEDNAYHRALQVAIFALDFEDDESLQKAEQLVKKATTIRERFIMELSLLSGKMARLSANESLNIIKMLMDTPDYYELFEYAYLLRDYAEFTTDYSESLRVYGKVLHRFQQTGRNDLCDQVLVAMSMFLAYKGNLEASRKLLKNASKKGNIAEHYILNNHAVIDILEGTMNNKTIEALNDALLIAGDIYESLIIKCNLLVCYTLLKDNKRAALICDSINFEEYTKFEYEEFLHIVYQDLYFFHFSFGDYAKAEAFKCEIKNLMQKISADSMAYRVAFLQLTGTHSPDEFYSKFPFRVDFLGNWDLEISRDLERFQ